MAAATARCRFASCRSPLPSTGRRRAARPRRDRCRRASRSAGGACSAVMPRTVVGGLTAAGRWPVQIAGAVMAGGVACLGFADSQPVVAGVATAGSPLGADAPRHQRRRWRDPGAGRSAGARGDGRGAGRSVPPCWPPFRAQAMGWPSARAAAVPRRDYRMRRVVAVDAARGCLARGGRPPGAGAADAARSGWIAGPGARARPRLSWRGSCGPVADCRALSRPRAIAATACSGRRWTRSPSCARSWAGCR